MSKIVLKRTDPNPPRIVQSRLKRDWMDETHKKHAYQCMPVSVANVMGWEVQMEEDLVVKWSGGNTPPEILAGEFTKSGRKQATSSIIGTISLHMGWIINTEPGYETWISGSPNYFIDGAVGLSATIPSWWWPDEVQMNWKITKENQEVVFPAGSPLCFFNIYSPQIIKDAEFEVVTLWDDKELVEARSKYGQLKSQNNIERPWTWTKGIKTGLDADGNQIGPTFAGLPALSEPIV
jgi:hypothetical protein